MLAPAVAASIASLLLLGRLCIAGAAANDRRGRPASITRSLIQLQPDVVGPESVNITSGYGFNTLVQILAAEASQPGEFADYGEASAACTGTLIAASLVISAGHCCVDANKNSWSPSLFRLIVGAYKLSSGGTLDANVQPIREGTVVTVSSVIVPGLYVNSSEAPGPDICVLRLSQPMSNTPASIVASNVKELSVSFFEYGWGIQDPLAVPRPPVTQLMGFESITVNCSTASYPSLAEAQYLCVQKPASIGGACEGDSGGPILQGSTILATITSGINTGNSSTFPKTCSGVDQYVDIYINLADPDINAWLMSIVQGTGPVGLGPGSGAASDLAEYSLGASPPPPGMTSIPRLQPPLLRKPLPAAPGLQDAADQATPTAYNLKSLEISGLPAIRGAPPPIGRHSDSQPSISDVTLGSRPPPVGALVSSLALMGNTNALMLPPPASLTSQGQSTENVLTTFMTSSP